MSFALERNRPAGYAVIFIATAACCATLLVMLMMLLRGEGAKHDFISFWAAGQRLAAHQNPYSPEGVLATERAAGYTHPVPLIMRNPPSALPLVLPLALVNARAGGLLWTPLLLGCLALSLYLLFRREGEARHRPLFVAAFSFGPAIACALAGQTALLALLGWTIFLCFHRTRPFAAGAALWLCLLKPHLFLPVLAVLVLWAARRRRYAILGGAAAALAISAAVTYAFDPAAWLQYRQMMSGSAGFGHELIPCLSGALRMGLAPSSPWVQFVPAMLGTAWALAYFWRRRHVWRWGRHGHLLLMISFLVAPYAWFTDQSILLPPLLFAAARVRSQAVLSLFLLASTAVQLEVLFGVGFHSRLHVLAAPVWLGCFLLARHSAAEERSRREVDVLHSMHKEQALA